MKKAGLAIAILGLGIVLALWYYPTARTETRIHHIGIVNLTAVDASTVGGFKKELAALGYPPNQAVRYSYDGPAGNIANLEERINKMLRRNVDLIFVSSTPATLAVKSGIPNVPAVFAPVNDPVGSGIVQSLRQPGGRITGIKLAVGDSIRFKWLRDLAPKTRTVYLPYNPEDKSAMTTLAQIRESVGKLGMELVEVPVRTVEAIEHALAYFPKEVDAIFLPRDSMVESRIGAFVQVALERKIPLSAPSYVQVEQGALFSYGHVHFEIGKQAARLAAMILEGADPSQLPVELSENHLSLNLSTAKAIGLEIPDHLLKQAGRIIRK